MEQVKKKITVFVTYRHENDEYRDKVISFTDFLRRNGFHAEMDALVSQEESAIDFPKMMHRIFTDYDKVIILLSPGYKERAENFIGGVGTEYGMLIKDFETNKNKYILATLLGMENLESQTPLFLKGKDVVDLKKSNFQSNLFAKLKGEQIISFSEVAEITPEVEKINPKLFESAPSLSIAEIQVKRTGNASFSYNTIKHIDYKVVISVTNNSSVSVSDFSLELLLPSKLYQTIEYYNNSHKIKEGIKSNREENGFAIIHCEGKKIYPKQTIEICTFTFPLRRDNYLLLDKNPIIAKLYTENGFEEKTIKINELFYYKPPSNMMELKVTLDSFGDT